jgi:hypothetical protein
MTDAGTFRMSKSIVISSHDITAGQLVIAHFDDRLGPLIFGTAL